MGIKEYNQKVKIILSDKEFMRRGNAFFRVVGDGVLQIIKMEYEVHDGTHYLRFGLFSMYGEMEKRMFTGNGCIPNYYAMEMVFPDYYCFPVGVGDFKVNTFRGKPSYIGSVKSVKESGHTAENFNKALQNALEEMKRRLDPDVQFKYFINICLPKLDSIVTQENLYHSMQMYSHTKKDYDMIFPLLCMGEREQALMILEHYLKIEAEALKKKPNSDITHYYYDRNTKIKELITNSSDIKLTEYLQTNYEKNFSYYC